MTQSTDPGLLSNIAFTLGNFQAWSAVYGRDVLALQLVSLICLFSLGWMPLIAVERWWATRPADGASARRRWALRGARVLVAALCGLMVLCAWISSLPWLRLDPGKPASAGVGPAVDAGPAVVGFDTPDATAKPNLLFIIADDMPALDANLTTRGLARLSARGVTFTNAHAHATKCSPSRAAMLTGLSIARTGLRADLHSMVWRHFHPSAQSLPEALKATGHWRVEGGGKIWHSRANIAVNAAEFDAYFGREGNRSAAYGHPLFCDEVDQHVYFVPGSSMKQFGTCRGVMADQRVVDWATARLRAHATAVGASPDVSPDASPDPSQALALFVGLMQTHLPWFSPAWALEDGLTAASADATLRRLNASDLLGEAPPAARAQCNRAFSEHIAPAGGGFVRDFATHWAATLAHADAMVDRLLDALDETGLAASTVVVFVSDHGYHAGHRDHIGKTTLWRQATHVPLVIAVPANASANVPAGTARGAVEPAPASVLDLFPTLLRALGAESAVATRRRRLAGRDLLAPSPPWRAVVSTHQGDLVTFDLYRAHALAYGDARFVAYDAARARGADEELYDATDADERRNLATSASVRRRRSDLRYALAHGAAGCVENAPPLSFSKRFALAPLFVDHLAAPAFACCVVLPLALVLLLFAYGAIFACCPCDGVARKLERPPKRDGESAGDDANDGAMDERDGGEVAGALGRAL